MAKNIGMEEIVQALSEKSGRNKKESREDLDNFVETIQSFLKEESKKEEKSRKKIQLIGFCNFEVKDSKARKGRNPQTGEEIDIPSKKNPTCKISKKFKETLN